MDNELLYVLVRLARHDKVRDETRLARRPVERIKGTSGFWHRWELRAGHLVGDVSGSFIIERPRAGDGSDQHTALEGTTPGAFLAEADQLVVGTDVRWQELLVGQTKIETVTQRNGYRYFLGSSNSSTLLFTRLEGT